MISQQSTKIGYVVLVLCLLLLMACERPFTSDAGPDISQVTNPDGNAVPVVEGEEVAPPDPAPVVEEIASPPPTEVATPPDSAEQGYPVGEVVPEEISPRPEEPVVDTTSDTEAPASSDDPPAEAEPTTNEAPTTAETPVESSETASPAENPAITPPQSSGPRMHTVQAGENLYRIGLQYGVSWVILAEYNQISNPNAITQGQTVNIPTDTAPDLAPTPTPVPTDEITYTVQQGDTLYRIGQRFNIDWRQIAEANGIVNPNRIVVGTTLKIPTSTPGPSPEFTHEVQPGETLFLISLKYGLTWETVAEANGLLSPYIIYPGNILSIPSN